MKEKFIKFMEGRYGVDGFARLPWELPWYALWLLFFSVMEAPRERF